jgi:hypothetical protein
MDYTIQSASPLLTSSVEIRNMIPCSTLEIEVMDYTFYSASPLLTVSGETRNTVQYSTMVTVLIACTLSKKQVT